MGLFQKVEETRSGIKVLVYGGTGTGKTTFALTFPKVCAIDSENGMAFYKNNPNLKFLLNSSSAQDVEEGLEEIEDELIDKIQTLVIDSETKIYENLQISGLNVAERRARKKGDSVDDANISQREWGKIKMINKKLQATKIYLASQGINILSVAQEKELKEKKGQDFVTVGYAPDTAKGFGYDYDLVLRLFTEKDKKTGEEVYKAEVFKDRTSTYKKGDIIENPSFSQWQPAVEKVAKCKIDVVNYNKDVDKDTGKMNSELENLEDLIKEFKSLMQSAEKSQQTAIKAELQKMGITNPLRHDSVEDMQKLINFIKTL